MYESVKIRTAVLLWTLWQAAAFYLLFIGGTDTFRDVIACLCAIFGLAGFVLFCIVSKADSEGVE